MGLVPLWEKGHFGRIQGLSEVFQMRRSPNSGKGGLRKVIALRGNESETHFDQPLTKAVPVW